MPTVTGAKPYQSALARKAGHDARQGTALAMPDPDGSLTSAQGKVDSETNTDLSILMMRRQQGYYQGGIGPAGQTAGGQYVAGQYGVRRPSAPLPGERYSNYRAMIYPRQQAGGGSMKLGSPGSVYMVRKDGGQATSDMGPEAYSASTLEQKRRAQMAAASAAAHSADYASNSLGRRRPGENIKEKLFGSRSSLNKMGNSENGNMASTIISNPHATYGRMSDASPTNYHGMPAANGRQYVNMYMTHSADGFPSTRPLSAMSSPVGASGGWMRSNAGMVANGLRSAMSETESTECLHNSIQAQIQQAKALAQASRNILAQNQHFTQSLQRSDSFRSTRSDRHGAVTSQAHTLPRTGSCTQISPTSDNPASPTPSHGTSFTYTSTPSQNGGSGVGYITSAPYTNLSIQSKLEANKDSDRKLL